MRTLAPLLGESGTTGSYGHWIATGRSHLNWGKATRHEEGYRKGGKTYFSKM